MAFYFRSQVPEDIDSVTTIRHDDEVPAKQLGGDPDELEKVWDLVLSLYESGIQPAIQICIRRHGEIVMNRSIGYTKGNGPKDSPNTPKTMVTPDTPFNIFSSSKANTATLIHLLDERGVLHVDDPVCHYIPDFARHGKESITIKHLLNHRAGISSIPSAAMKLDVLSDPAALLELLCDLEPDTRAGGRLAYHAITGGFVLAEVVQRAAGKSIRTVMNEEIVKPLGFRWMNYGVPNRDVAKVADSYFTGARIVPPMTRMIHRLLGMQLHEVTEMSNDPRFLTAIIPSANVIATADELSRFYQMLLNGGELDGVRLLEKRTVRRATAEQSWMEPDMKLFAPIRYSQGFMLGADCVSVFGPDTDKVFGHLGLTNIMGWADPERQITGALMTSGKPMIYPGIWNWYTIPWQIATAFGKAHPRAAGGRKTKAKAKARKPPVRRKAQSKRRNAG